MASRDVSAAGSWRDLRLPSRRGGRRRDRHGRGMRGPLLPPALPGALSRAERFDRQVLEVVGMLEARLGAGVDGIEFAVEDVPPSNPAPWEDGSVPLARYFPADGAAGLTHRIVLYRRPIVTRCVDALDVGDLVREVLVEQVAVVLGLPPEDVDPGW